MMYAFSSDYFISTYAGYTVNNYDKRGDGDIAQAATISMPYGIHVDEFNNIFLTESQFIRRIDGSTKLISTYAGGGDDSTTNDIFATAAYLPFPYGVAGDTAGNIYYADSTLSCVRKISAGICRVSTVVGECGTSGVSSNANSGLAIRLLQPRGLFYYSPDNVMYIADSSNHVVLAFYVNSNRVVVVAGLVGLGGYSSDGIATSETLWRPSDVFVDSLQNLYIADTDNQRVRFVSNSTKVMSTVAGTGSFGSTGDGAAATSATIFSPSSVCLDASGNMLIFSIVDNQVRVVSNGIITTPVGSASQVGLT
ncbi:hypothetical protein EON65_09860 [archaeon]|nr:MAG: hypothetical protein EON65_09860 [archaeon]